MKPHLLFIDDEKRVLDALQRILRPYTARWDVSYAGNGEEAWDLLQQESIDVVVTDVVMPGLNGLQLLKRMQDHSAFSKIPVVVLTGLEDQRLKRNALELGATDLLNKPVAAEDLLARIRNALRLKHYHDELRQSNDRLESQVWQRTEELFCSRLDMIWRLARVAEFRDASSGNHVIRVGCASRIIATELGLDRHVSEGLFLAAPLHDIGKIGIPDAVLLKRGALSRDEWRVMKSHCRIGERILSEDSQVKTVFQELRAAPALAIESLDRSLLETAASIALNHHERWDGSGYPQGLMGAQIPVEARVVAVADVYDALLSRRPYKSPYPEEVALEIMAQNAEAHFDPDVYQAFLRALPEVQVFQSRFPDPPQTSDALEESWDEAYSLCGR